MKVTINGQEIGEATDVHFEHLPEPPLAHVEDIVRTDYEVTATAKLTRYGRRFMQSIRWAYTPAAQAGFMLVHKGRGRYILQRYPFGKRGNKRNIFPYNQKGKK